MNIEIIKIISALFSIIGSAILAYRVTGILKALSLVAGCHDQNIKQLMPDNHENIIYLDNSTAHIERAQKNGLLITGFIFIILSGVMQLFGLLIAST